MMNEQEQKELHERVNNSINKYYERVKNFHPEHNVAQLDERKEMQALLFLHYKCCNCDEFSWAHEI